MSTRSSIPESLKDDSLRDLWQKVRQRLDKFGPERRGSITLPKLSDNAALTLSSLLNKTLTSRIDLTELEQALSTAGVGPDLPAALDKLGVAASVSHQQSRIAVERRQQARVGVNSMIEQWVQEENELAVRPSTPSWQVEWADWLFRSGLMANADAETAVQQVADVRRLLDYIKSEPASIARNDIAVRLYGSAHALDDGSTLECSARRALWHSSDQSPDYSQGRAVWHAAGITTDRVSTPVLTWQLPLQHGTELGDLCNAANDAGLPLHLSLFALNRFSIQCKREGNSILVVENPRIVEAAAERGLQQAIISTNGNPTASLLVLVQSLIAQGSSLHYHGDFDSAGLAICKRMMELGCTPWKMATRDYLDALRKANSLSVQLPTDNTLCGETPWDHELQRHMRSRKLVVHEEFLIEELFAHLAN